MGLLKVNITKHINLLIRKYFSKRSCAFKPEVLLLALIKTTLQRRASLYKIVIQMEELDSQVRRHYRRAI